MAPLIAVIGCDGSGKSTLAEDLRATIAASGKKVAGSYLGLRSGVMGNRIKALPLVGPWAERQLSIRAGKARDKGGKIPGLPTALVIWAFSLVRARRFRRMLRLREAGVIVVTDRYPQIEVPGFYDGPGLSAAKPDSWLTARIAAKERALYEWMAGHVPDLVIRLNVDADTAFARKPDHKYASLQAKVAVTPHLRFNGAHIVDFDATMPYDEELALARAAVDQALT
jgi:hypothetical protein